MAATPREWEDGVVGGPPCQARVRRCLGDYRGNSVVHPMSSDSIKRAQWR